MQILKNIILEKTLYNYNIYIYIYTLEFPYSEIAQFANPTTI